MKKPILFICFLLMIGCGHTGKFMSVDEVRSLSQQSLDSKITALAEDTAPDSADIGYTIDSPSVTPTSKKATWGNILTKAHGLGNWKLPYTNGSGVKSALSLGADDTFLVSTGAAAIPEFRVLADADVPDTITITNLSQVQDVTIAAASLNAFDDGLTTQILVGGGAGVVPVWGTDIPTAVTIGSAYIYRAGGTDVPDADVADDITLTNITQISSRAITSLTSSNYKLFYSAGGGAPLELSLGAAGTYLRGAGASSAPTMEAIQAGDLPAAIDPDKIGTDGTANDKIEAENINIVSMDITAVDSIVWSASGMSADGTQCAAPAEVTINSGPKMFTVICTDNDASTLYGHVVMPDGWNAGTVTFELSVLQTAADTANLNGDISAQCRGSGEVPSSTWGTEIAMDITGLTGSNAVDTVTSAAVTPAGTCAAGDNLWWRWQMDATGTTTAVATLHFLANKMEFTKIIGDE